MNTKNTFWIIAGVLNFLIFLLHLTGGQIELVDPMLETGLPLEKSSQLIGAWHMVSIVILWTSYILVMAGLGKKYNTNLQLIKLVAYLNLFFCAPFIGAGFYYGILVPQWIFFLPIFALTLLGLRKVKAN